MMRKEKQFFRTLKNKNGVEITCCDFGAVISSLTIPVSENENLDVVLGFDTIEDYAESFMLVAKPFLGAVVGPHAGRVHFGKYKNGIQEIQLEQNHGPHHLHGGSLNLSNQFWNLVSAFESEIQYEILINDLKTKITAEYSLNDKNELNVVLQAVTEEDILINLTQHSYFNLDGHQGDVRSLKMQVNAEEVLESDDDLIPTGNFLTVQDTPFDFSILKTCPAKIDTSFVLRGEKTAAILTNERNGLTLKVETNQPSVHIYVGGSCDHITGKENTVYHHTSGICFEAQNFPDSPNHENFKSGILKPGEKYSNEIKFTFEIN
ncbi:aldose epimerase family protein [Chryseobacterium sp. JUb7]|uniref:aldose epimerase family protein n=1 Tax=Chryseobacterium sp. JUb7 TaxID=2940599 RepID=UPI002169DBFB|nr:aldose epimerase family protein [Chryseobacterium sp. JUb7]MCS3529294.1 aldose 1-epimerase [Chryseobacterium sp. JUb7]